MKILCIPRPSVAGSKAICTHRGNAAAEIAPGNPLSRALTLQALRYQWIPQVRKVREEDVIFQVASEIEAGGITVAPGTYPGTKKQLGAPFMGKTAWQDPEYRLILPTPGTQFLYAEVDVTPHVLAGTVSVE